MLIRSRAPLRLGLAGGGTDVSPFSDEFGGCTVNASIDMYAYCVIEPTSDGHIEFHAADGGGRFHTKSANHLTLTDGRFRLHQGVYNRVVTDFIGEPLSFRMTTYSDAGPGSGLGGSSTLAVAVLNAFCEWLGIPLGDYDSARLAYEIERVDVGFPGGKQDQYAATFGGFNFMEFHEDRVVVNPLRIKPWVKGELETLMLLYRTGATRDSGKIIQEQMANVRAKKAAPVEAMLQLKEDAVTVKEALLFGDIDSLAKTINRGWEAKKRMAASVSNQRIDTIMQKAQESGALAGRVTGAGGGGYMLFLVRLERRDELINALESFGGATSRVLFTDRGTEAWKILPSQRTSTIKFERPVASNRGFLTAPFSSQRSRKSA